VRRSSCRVRRGLCVWPTSRHARPLLTLFGEVRITRIGYGAPGREAIHPLDAELRLPDRIYSYECQRRLMRVVICSPFDEAICLVAEMTGVSVPKRSAEQLVREAAVDFEAFYAQRVRADVKPARGEILIAAIDCKGIPMVKPERALRVVRPGKGEKANKKRMATVAAVHSQAPVVRTPKEVLDSLFQIGEQPERPKRTRPSHKRVWASLISDKDTFIADVKAEMTRRDPHHRRTWVIVTDGERALQRRVCETFDGVTHVLDLLHALEKLWKVAHALHPEGSREAETFVYQRTERLLGGQVDQVVKGLRLIITKRQLTGTKAKTLRDVASYYQPRPDALRQVPRQRLADRLRIRRRRLQEPHPRPVRTLRHALDHRNRRSPPAPPRRPPLRRLRRLLELPRRPRPAAAIPLLAGRPEVATPKPFSAAPASSVAAARAIFGSRPLVIVRRP